MKRLFKLLLIIITVFVAWTTLPSVTFACKIGDIKDCDESLIVTTYSKDLCGEPINCITFLVNIVFLIAVLLAFIYLLWAGIDYITAGGDSAAAGNARTKMTNAVIGLIIVIVAWAISNFVLSFFGLPSDLIPLQPNAASSGGSTSGGGTSGGGNGNFVD